LLGCEIILCLLTQNFPKEIVLFITAEKVSTYIAFLVEGVREGMFFYNIESPSPDRSFISSKIPIFQFSISILIEKLLIQTRPYKCHDLEIFSRYRKVNLIIEFVISKKLDLLYTYVMS
jgi:hypothetical protein